LSLNSLSGSNACDHSGPPRHLSDEQIEEWRAIAATADVFFDFDWLEPSAMAERCPNLKWIQGTSAGIGSLMQHTGLDQTSIITTTAGGIHAVPLGEFALMGALYFVKGVPFLNARKSQHHWERYTTRQLRGLRVLVVGLGGIGREIVRVFDAMGVEVSGLGRTGHHYDVEGLRHVIDRNELDGVLPNVDIVVLAAPLTTETEGMIGAHEISLLGQDAVLINISRGQLVDEAALIVALRDGAIAGACLDVFEREPLPEDSPLWELENVIISPHSASTVRTENRDLVELFLENMGHWRKGEPMRNRYDAKAGY
jgi:glyoxylate/hydroxypyruvate reductase A